MLRKNQALIWLLRVIGTMDLTAIAFVIAPHSVVAAIHQWLGLGEFPQQPIADWLVRHVSLWYAIYGLLLWFVSFDTQKYASLIGLLATILFLQGLVAIGIDLTAGLPSWWIGTEGPMCAAMGLSLYVTQRRSS